MPEKGSQWNKRQGQKDETTSTDNSKNRLNKSKNSSKKLDRDNNYIPHRKSHALAYDRTLPGLTQGKRLTSANAELSVQAKHESKPWTYLSPQYDGKLLPTADLRNHNRTDKDESRNLWKDLDWHQRIPGCRHTEKYEWKAVEPDRNDNLPQLPYSQSRNAKHDPEKSESKFDPPIAVKAPPPAPVVLSEPKIPDPYQYTPQNIQPTHQRQQEPKNHAQNVVELTTSEELQASAILSEASSPIILYPPDSTDDSKSQYALNYLQRVPFAKDTQGKELPYRNLLQEEIVALKAINASLAGSHRNRHYQASGKLYHRHHGKGFHDEHDRNDGNYDHGYWGSSVYNVAGGGHSSVPPEGATREGSPFSGIPIINRNKVHQNGMNVDVSQNYIPGRLDVPPEHIGRSLASGRQTSRKSNASSHTSRLDVTINEKYHGSSVVGGNSGGHAFSEPKTKDVRVSVVSFNEQAKFFSDRDVNVRVNASDGDNDDEDEEVDSEEECEEECEEDDSEGECYEDDNDEDKVTESKCSNSTKDQRRASKANAYPSNTGTRRGGNGPQKQTVSRHTNYDDDNCEDDGLDDDNCEDDGLDDDNCVDEGFDDVNCDDDNRNRDNYRGGNDRGGGNGNQSGNCCTNTNTIPYPIPYPMPMPMPCPCPPPPPPPPACCQCCCKKKKKKKKKDNKHNQDWNMMTMYGMYSLFQQMHLNWTSQLQEQFTRSQQPQQQYGVMFANPMQMMMSSMMNGCGQRGLRFFPNTCGEGGGGGASQPNTFFEVAGMEVRDTNYNGDAGSC